MEENSVSNNYYKIQFPNGNIYKGQVKICRTNDGILIQLRDGYGTTYYNDGHIFSGQYVNDTICGFGEYYYYKNNEKKLIYIGYWKNNRRDGIGIFYYEDNAYFQGEWVNGYKNGIGTYTFSDGSRYIGYFKNDMRDYYGIIYGNNISDKYEGSWINDSPNGEGIYYYSNGDKYIGQFKNSKRNGWGIYQTNEGIETKGFWKDEEFMGEKNQKFKKINLKIVKYFNFKINIFLC